MNQEIIFTPYIEPTIHTSEDINALTEEIKELHKSFSILNTIVGAQEEDIENIHEQICMTTQNVKEANLELSQAEYQASSYRFTNVSLGAMTGVLFAAGIEMVLPGSGIISGAILGGISGLLWK